MLSIRIYVFYLNIKRWKRADLMQFAGRINSHRPPAPKGTDGKSISFFSGESFSILQSAPASFRRRQTILFELEYKQKNDLCFQTLG